MSFIFNPATNTYSSSEETRDNLSTIPVSKSVDYSASIGDFVLMTTGATNKTVILPTAVLNSNGIIDIKKVDSGLGDIVVDAFGSETIDGEITQTLTTQWTSVTFQSDGSNWIIK